MPAIIAHGSGWDEIAIFASVPLLYLAYYWIRRTLAARRDEVWPGPEEPNEPDADGEDGGRRG